MSDDLTEQAIMAYNAYLGKMRTCGGNYTHDCSYHMKHWYGVAKLADKLNVSVEQIIGARFAATTDKLHRSITPAQLYKPLSIVKANLKAYMPNPTEDYRKSYKRQCIQLNNFMRRGLPGRLHSELDVLADPNQPFAAWFRVLYPDKIDERIINWYMADTIDLYKQDHELRQFIEEDLNGRNVERIVSRIL